MQVPEWEKERERGRESGKKDEGRKKERENK